MTNYPDHPRIAQTLLDQQGDINRLTAELAEMRGNYEGACKTVADMHAAATGRRGLGPVRGVVEDVEDVRLRAEQAETERDGAYRERAHLLAWLATLHGTSAVLAPALDIDDENGWHLLFLTVAGRQLSWHIAPRDMDLLKHVERVDVADPRAQWDGHTTDEKYQRIRTLPWGEMRDAVRTPEPDLVDLLKRAESHLSALHGSVARHDNLAANLACSGCELRDAIHAALDEPTQEQS